MKMETFQVTALRSSLQSLFKTLKHRKASDVWELLALLWIQSDSAFSEEQPLMDKKREMLAERGKCHLYGKSAIHLCLDKWRRAIARICGAGGSRGRTGNFHQSLLLEGKVPWCIWSDWNDAI
ncbi:hypothetical protein CapIbe_017593 [Capra ibex]